MTFAAISNSRFSQLSDRDFVEPEFVPLHVLSNPHRHHALADESSRPNTDWSGIEPDLEQIAISVPDAPFQDKQILEVMETQLRAAHDAIASAKNEIEELKVQHSRELQRIDECNTEKIKNIVRIDLLNIEARIGDRIAHEVSQILSPFVEGQIKVKLIEKFRSLLAECLAENGAGAIRIIISGPGNFLRAFKSQTGNDAANFTFIENSEIEILAEIDDHKIATRFAHWKNMLGSAET